MTWTPDPATSSVFATLTLNGAIFVVLLCFFEFVRNQNEIYAPRRRLMSHRTPAIPNRDPLNWIPTVFACNDNELLRICGADGYVFYRYIRMLFKAFGICSIIALCILFPVYGTGAGNPGVAGLNLYSMGNIVAGGSRLWAPCIMSYVFTGIFLYFFYNEYAHFVLIRRNFFKEGDVDTKTQKDYSVQVENVPIEYRSSEKLFQFFDDLFEGEIMYACISVDTKVLTKVVSERKDVIVKLEGTVAAWQSDDKGIRPVLKLKAGRPSFCGGNEEVDAIDYWTEQLKQLNAEVARLKEMAVKAENAAVLKVTDEENQIVEEKKILKDLLAFDKIAQITKKDVCGTGFVTFKSRRTQIAACQLPVLSEEYPDIIIFPAPAPNDVVWSNIAVNPFYTDYVSSITYTVYYMGLLFWGIILAFIAAISSLTNLQKFLPFVKSLDPVTYAILAGQLPVTIIIGFISLLPVIMKAVSTYIEKRKSHSVIQQEIFSWFFVYQLANVYLMLFAGSIFGALAEALKKPTSIVFLLGASVPGVSIFFLNYVITTGLTGLPMLLLRLGPYAMYKVFRIFFKEKNLTRRSLVEGPLAPFSLDYGVFVPPVIYIAAIVLNYWVISPIVLVVGCLYFGGAVLVWKYLLMFVIMPSFQGGGIFFYGFYKYSMICLMAGTITGIGFMAIKQGAGQTPLMIPLPFIIILVWRYTEKKFLRLSASLPFSIAIADDKGLEPDKLQAIYDEFTPNYLRQPEFLLVDIEKPYPYRLNNVPLLKPDGHLSEVYWADCIQDDNADGEIKPPRVLPPERSVRHVELEIEQTCPASIANNS